MRDDRDTATVEWVDAPANLPTGAADHREEPATGGHQARAPGYDPYETVTPQRPQPPTNVPAKRDLRKLSAWIKQMREIEERKKRGED